MLFPIYNSCEGKYKSLDIHFTSICNNKCPYCIDKNTPVFGDGVTHEYDILDTVLKYKDKVNDVLILGGEPLLFIDKLYILVKGIKENSTLKVYVTTSMPHINKDKVDNLLEIIDGLNISVHHYQQRKADIVRGSVSDWERNCYYKSLLYKEKIRICLNLVKGILDDRDDLYNNVFYFSDFGQIKINELQNSPKYYVSFENIFQIKIQSSFIKCQTEIGDMFGLDKDKVILKRSCFLVEPTKKARIIDIVKIISRYFSPKKEKFFGVVYEDGSFANSWIKKEGNRC